MPAAHTQLAKADHVRFTVLLSLMLLLAPASPNGLAAPAPIAPVPAIPRSVHWAFQPVQEPKPPAVRNAAWPHNEIDRFVLARLEQAGLTPAPPADPRTLLRRMSFTLTGLPPSLQEVEAFAAAHRRDAQAAIAAAAERLLASPRYGERWGRHWLDLARYSDTKGYVYAREERRFVHSPTYRDWVIRALNEDMPYDRFLLLQIAGDQLVPENSPDLAALGFVTGGRRFIGVTHDIIDDRIDVVTRGTLGLTVQCARCHDHKYDPIPTADYYSLYGVFHGTEDRLVQLDSIDDRELAERRRKLEEITSKRIGEAEQRLRARVGDYLAAQLELQQYPEEGFDQILGNDDIIPASVRRWRDYLLRTRDPADPIFGPWHALASLPSDQFAAEAPAVLEGVRRRGTLHPWIAAEFATPPESMRDVAARYGKVFAEAESATGSTRPEATALRQFLRAPESPATVPDTGIQNNDMFFPTSAGDEIWKHQGDVERRLIELGARAALALRDRPPEPNPRVFKRGNPSRLGDEVPRQFLAVLAGPRRQPFSQGSGRLELARAIVDPSNPLTARVWVNRIWQHHFGDGLVRTPSDFGLRAEPPTHPELLDWLACRLIDEGWSLKSMHRLLLASATWQMASGPAPTGDPDHKLLSAFPIRRLEFEPLRDAMLLGSDELDLTQGGRSVELLGPANTRRTVYALVDRQFLPGAFRTFDFANPDIHVATRHETTVPQQALFFLNSTFASARARALAARLPDRPPAERIQFLHRTLFQRDPTRRELAAGLRFLAAAEAEPPPPPASPPPPTQWQYGTGAIDELTGAVHTFTPLPHFTGAAWQGAPDWPGGETGWAQLTAEGGHPGNSRQHAVIRRWVAPRAVKVRVEGQLKHEPEAGDGVRAWIVSSRHGDLRYTRVHHGETSLKLPEIQLETGDTLDFAVDIGDVLNSDQFLWSPRVVASDETWDAKEEFSGPPPPMPLLTAWEQYAQVLLLSNEFAFVD